MHKTSGFSSKLRNIFFNTFLIIISSVIASAIGEIYFRLFQPQSIIPRYVETSPYGIRKNIGNVSGEMITSEYKHEFRTNSQGFRGNREYSLKKPSNIFRIIVLGDSVVLGHGVADDKTFSAVLEKKLSQERRTEVINMGVSGFGTAEELIQFRNTGLKYDPDLVIIGYFPNDPYNIQVSKLFKIENGSLVQDQKSFVPATFIRDQLYKIPGYSFLSQHSHLLNFIRSQFSSYYTKKLGRENKIKSTTPRVLSKKQMELTAALINEFISELNNNKLPLIILNIPLISQGRTFTNLPKELIKSDKFTYLIDVKEEIYSGHSLEKISYKKDRHPKPFGHQLIAEWLESFVKKKIWQEIQ